jgi:hypothetical protein
MGYLGNQITTVFPTSISVDTATIATANISNQLTDANMSAGSVLQVVTATDSTERTTTSTTFVTASNTLSVAITPSSTSSKIFVTSSFSYGSPSGTHSFFPTIYRDSTNLGTSNGFGNLFDGTLYNYAHATLNILDSPSTTSSVTYQIYFKVGNNTGRINNSGSFSSITAFEIAG